MPEASRIALDVAERYANGEAMIQELTEARHTAFAGHNSHYDAAYGATYPNAYCAACDSTFDAYISYDDYVAYDTAYGAPAARRHQEELLRQLCQGTAPWQIDQ